MSPGRWVQQEASPTEPEATFLGPFLPIMALWYVLGAFVCRTTGGPKGSASVLVPGGSGAGGSGPLIFPPSIKSGKLKGPLPGKKSPQPKVVSAILSFGLVRLHCLCLGCRRSKEHHPD